MYKIEAIEGYLNAVADGLKQDAEDKGQKFPVDSLRVEITTKGGELYAADYAKYLIYGRPPGKQPPPEKIQAWVASQPEASSWTPSEINSMAFLVGRKIARVGTDIWEGKRQGIDLLGVMDRSKEQFLAQLAEGETLEVATTLRQTIQ